MGYILLFKIYLQKKMFGTVNAGQWRRLVGISIDKTVVLSINGVCMSTSRVWREWFYLGKICSFSKNTFSQFIDHIYFELLRRFLVGSFFKSILVLIWCLSDRHLKTWTTFNIFLCRPVTSEYYSVLNIIR